MGRKRTAKANKIIPPKLRVYEIGIEMGEDADVIKIRGTSYGATDSFLNIYDNTNGTNLVATFRYWHYILCVDSDFDYMKDSVYASPDDLPEGWGKVNGTDVFG